MALIWRFLRILRWTILIVLAFAAGMIAVLTLTDKGRENLAGLISDMASSPDSKVKLTGLDGIWSGYLKLDSLVLEDAEGPWLAVRGAEIDWSPLALFSATFRAERIHAARIEVARLPKTKERSGGGSSSLPVSLSLKKIDLPDIALGAELAGGVASISAKGFAEVDGPMNIDGEIKIARTDGKAGDISAKVKFAPADNMLDIDVVGSEPKGGIIANLLKLPGEPAVDILVSGSGPAANWQGSGSVSIDRVVVARVSGTHVLTDKGSRVEAKGDGEFARFLPEKFRPLLAGRTVFDLAGTATTEGGVEVERASLESNGLSGTASGTVNPAGATDFALELNATGGGLPLAFGTDESPIDITVASASIRAFGDGRTPALDIAATLPAFATRDVSVNNIAIALHSDEFDLKGRAGPVSANLAADAIVIDNPTVASLVAGKVSAEFAGALSTEALAVNSGTLRSDAIDGKFSGNVALTDGSIGLKLDAVVQSAALPVAAHKALADTVTIAADIARDAKGNVSANSLSVVSGGLTVDGLAKVGEETIEADIKGKLADISQLAPDTAGAIDFAVKVSGARNAPDLSLTVSSDKLTAAEREITGLNLTATGKADMANPAASVSLTGNVAGEELKGDAVLSTTGGKRTIKQLALTLGQNRVLGDLELDDAFVPLGAITFDLPDLGPLAALAFEKVTGSLSGNARFLREGGKPRIVAEARIPAFARGEVSGKDIVIDATVDDYLAAPAIAGTVRAASVASGNTVVSDIAIDLSRDGPWTGFDGGATVAGIPAKAKGRVQSAGGTTTVELATAEATVKGVRAAINKASTIRIAGGKTSLDGLTVNLGSGQAVVSGTAGEALDIDVRLAALPASIANSFAAGLGLAGTISGTVKVTGKAAAPSVAYDVNWGGAETAQTRAAGIGALTIGSDGTFAANRLNFNATANGRGGLTIRAGGAVETAGARALNLSVTGTLPFSTLSGKLAAQGMALDGSAAVDLKITGTPAAPVIAGSIRSDGSRFVHAGSGMALNGLGADIIIGGGVATVRRLGGSLSSGGTVAVTGTVGINPGSGFPADLAIKLSQGRYTDGRMVTANFDGDLAIKGSLLASPALAGTINLAKTVLSIPDRLPSSLSTLDVKHKNAPAAVREQDRVLRPEDGGGGARGSGALTLDLTINAPERIFVQGRGLDAELGGTLKLTGSTASPQAVGQFELKRGRLSLLAKRLDFTEGTIGFAGSMVPTINFAAETTTSDAVVTVRISGQANNPKFSFTSVPALPEDEVLARLIFGRSMSNLSPLQIAQLADAAAQLSGAGGSTSLLQSLRSKIGVDDLDVKTDEKGSASVAAGKYLNDRTYLSLEKGEKPGSGKATIDLNVGRGIKLRGQASDSGEAKGGIFYEREY